MCLKKISLLFISMSLFGCAEDDPVDIQETAQQIGDVMASIDESGGDANGTMAHMVSHQKMMVAKEDQLFPWTPKDFILSLTKFPKAQAVSCTATAFGACTSSQKVRDLNGCTVGSATFSGDVTLSFSDAGCVLNSDNDLVHRSPDFTVTGRRGATLTVSKSGTNGQTVTRTSAGVFTFANDGIRRIFSLGSRTLFDYTTTTVTPLNITGTTRANRVVNGGSLRVLNNSTSVSCDYAPSNVTWSSTCNCATSGSWTGTCTDGKSSSVSITGCGSATIVVGDQTESLSFDRCTTTN